MNAVAEFLIAVLTDFKTEGPVAQIGFVALVLGAVFGAAIWFVRRVNKRVDVLIGTERDLKARLDKQLGIIEGLRKERDANADLLDQLDPDRFRKALATARRTSLSAAEAEAETYVDWHAPALKDAYGLLLQARLAEVEYGESALLAARRHAMGAIAADPHDLDAQASLKTVDALLDAEARTPETEAAKTERAERDALLGEIEAAPEDPDVLHRVAAKFFARGHYRLAEAVAERALEAAAAAGRNPDGEFGLRVRFRMIESAIFGGRHMRAEQVLDPALEAAKRTQGPDAAVTLSLRSVQGSLALSQGRAAEAEALYAGRLAPEAFEHRDLAEARARWLPDDDAAPPAAAS